MPPSKNAAVTGEFLDPAQTTLSLQARRTMDRLIAEGIQPKVARQLAIALHKSEIPAKAISKAEGAVPPKGVQSACQRGLDLAPEYGGSGLTAGAKSRARSMSNGQAVSPENLKRMKAFFARHDSYPKQGGSDPSPGYVAWMLWGGDAGKAWAESQVAKLEKSAATFERAALFRSAHRQGIQKKSYTEAFTDAVKEILPPPLIQKLHVRARAIAGGHGRAAARAAQAAAEAQQAAVSKAEDEDEEQPKKKTKAKPMGAAFSRARATGEDQSHEARKRRANAYLKERGHEPIGKMEPNLSDVRVERFLEAEKKRKQKKGEEDEGEKPVKKSEQVSLAIPVSIVKAEETQWERQVLGIVYEPNTRDSHGDFMTAATIKKAAHAAMRDGIFYNHEHGPNRLGAHLVESWVAPCEMQLSTPQGPRTIKEGTWLTNTQVTDDDLWSQVLSGEYVGLSLEGSALATPRAQQAA